MSFIVKGINLPKDEKKPLRIEIWSNGDIYKDYSYGYEYKEGIAVEISTPHGDLIDRRVLLREVMGITDGWMKPRKDWFWYEDSIRYAPTIIEAEEENDE